MHLFLCREAGKVDDPYITANLEESLSSSVDRRGLPSSKRHLKDYQGFGPYQNKPFKSSGSRPSGSLPCLNHSW